MPESACVCVCVSGVSDSGFYIYWVSALSLGWTSSLDPCVKKEDENEEDKEEETSGWKAKQQQNQNYPQTLHPPPPQKKTPGNWHWQ